MRKKSVVMLVSMMLTLAIACSGIAIAFNYINYVPSKTPGDSQFDFDGNYTPPELKVDGVADEAAWTSDKAIDIGVFGRGGNAVSAKMYRGISAMFFFYNVTDKYLLTNGNSNDDSVTEGDSVELYLDTLLDGANKPQSDDYQINLGIHGKTRIMQGAGSQWGAWNGLIDYEVKLDGTLNDGIASVDNGYSVELMIPYAQVGMQPNDAFGISLGQVDKINLGNNAGDDADYGWFGWNYNGHYVNPQMPSEYIVVNSDNTLCLRDEMEKPDASMSGYIKDEKSGNALADVKVGIEGTQIKTVTDSQGYFIFTDINPEKNYTIIVSADDYYDNSITYTRAELRDANGGIVTKQLKMLSMADAEKTTLVGSVKNVIDGYVSGVTVKAEGTTLTATTNANGQFILNNVPVVTGVILNLSKIGFETSAFGIDKSDVQLDGTTTANDISLNRAYNTSVATFGGNRGINSFDVKMTRSLTGLYFKFTTATKFEENEFIEFYLQAGAMSEKPFGLFLHQEGNITLRSGTQFQTANSEALSTLEYEVIQNADINSGCAVILQVPYAFMKMNFSDVFGFSGGVSAYETNGKIGWDGFGFDGFVDPVIPTSYIRCDNKNKLYKSPNNDVQVEIKGNVGLENIKVEFGGKTVYSNVAGAYSLIATKPTLDGNVTFSKLGYISVVKSVTAADFNNSLIKVLDAELTEKFVEISGVVTDNTNGGTVLAGVTVTVEGMEISAVTGADGRYTLSDVPTIAGIKLLAVKDGYTSVALNISVNDLNFVELTEIDMAMADSSNTIVLDGIIKNILGVVAGATVSIENTEISVTTDSLGSFVFNNAPVADYNIIIEKEGYERVILAIKAGDLVGDNHSLGIIDFKLAYAETGKFATKSDQFGNFDGYITRGLDAFEFKFVSTKTFAADSRIELFIDTGASSSGKSAGDYLFNLKQDGSIQIVDWDGENKNEIVLSGMTLSVTTEGVISTLIFNLPYSFFALKGAEFSVLSTDVIGISIGSFSGSANDWDGWVYVTGTSEVEGDFVKPESTKDYIRISKENILYWSSGNTDVNVNTPIRFGKEQLNLADNFFADVSRDETGITFNFTAFGTFEATEFVYLYIDKGNTSANGWAFGTEDYQIKLYGDGTIYYKKSATPWWKTDRTDTSSKLGDYEITRKSGITSFSFKLDNSTFEISATEIIGFCLREAKDNEADMQLYDPWHDCYFEGTQIDAAVQTDYIRIGADGSLYFKADNSVL